jgi:SAM-dependent methyltransferase
MSRFLSLGWRPAALTSPAKTEMEGIPEDIRAIRYPFRLLRYWIAHELLAAEAQRRDGAALRVCEIGVDRGQMLRFSAAALQSEGRPLPWREWDAVDCSPCHESLQKAGYSQVMQIDAEDADQMAQLPRGRYDVVILLHVLEHLYQPGRVLADIARSLRPGGIIIGGCPATPEFARTFWQRRLRRKQLRLPRGRHVSVISGPLLSRWSEYLGMETELMTGAFFMRKKGFALENHAWWLKLNLAFGALFPSWPGEIYWSWRKPLPQHVPAAATLPSGGALPLGGPQPVAAHSAATQAQGQ